MKYSTGIGQGSASRFSHSNLTGSHMAKFSDESIKAGWKAHQKGIRPLRLYGFQKGPVIFHTVLNKYIIAGMDGWA